MNAKGFKIAYQSNCGYKKSWIRKQVSLKSGGGGGVEIQMYILYFDRKAKPRPESQVVDNRVAHEIFITGFRLVGSLVASDFVDDIERKLGDIH